MNAVVVYSTKRCMGCKWTIQTLARAGVDHEVVELEADPGAVALLKAMGFTSAPVVSTGDRWWSGYRPDLLRQIAGDPAPANA